MNGECDDSRKSGKECQRRTLYWLFYSTTSQRDLWIGLQKQTSLRCGCDGVTADECESCRATWSWYDGTPMNWWLWMDGEPDIYGNCGRLGPESWAENACNIGLKYICERGSNSALYRRKIYITVKSQHLKIEY